MYSTNYIQLYMYDFANKYFKNAIQICYSFQLLVWLNIHDGIQVFQMIFPLVDIFFKSKTKTLFWVRNAMEHEAQDSLTALGE